MSNSNSNKNPIYWIPSTWFAMGLPFVALAASSAIMYKIWVFPIRKLPFGLP
jgi:hypothetical protein